MSTFNQLASKRLGTANTYATDSQHFDTELLVALPRSLAREAHHITGNEFIGYDVWHAHEATFLTNNGLPITGTLKICYPSESPNIIESKSMKLYLNSFDMCRMGTSIKNAIDNYTHQIQKDLTHILSASVSVFFHQNVSEYDTHFPGKNFTNIYTFLANEGILENLIFDTYTSDKNHLTLIEKPTGKYIHNWCIPTLRTRCRITRQKDSGYLYCKIESMNSVINPVSLLRQVISMREIEEFHEFCAEKIFCQIKSLPTITRLSVFLLFARRGGIDINPIRVSHPEDRDGILTDVTQYTPKTQMQ